MKNSSEPQGWREDLQRLRSLEYIPKTQIDLFEYLSEAHYRAKDRLAKEKIYPSLSQEKAQEMLSQGFPLIDFDQISIKAEPLRDHFKEICAVIGKYEETNPSQIKRGLRDSETGDFGTGGLGDKETGGQVDLPPLPPSPPLPVSPSLHLDLDLKEFIRKTLFQGADYLRGISEKMGIEESTLEFMALTLARPLFELAASDMKAILAEYPWWQNCCPACGGPPFMARIRREDGMRILHCSLCAVEWKFARVKCPFCNNEDQKSLKFFYYLETEPYRLYVCERCKHYIKSVDERKIDQSRIIDMAVEDVATLYLDTLAREKGYLPPSSLSQDITIKSMNQQDSV